MICAVFFSAGHCVPHVQYKYSTSTSRFWARDDTNWAGLMIFDSLTKKLPTLSATLTWSVSRLTWDTTTPLRGDGEGGGDVPFCRWNWGKEGSSRFQPHGAAMISDGPLLSLILNKRCSANWGSGGFLFYFEQSNTNLVWLLTFIRQFMTFFLYHCWW